MGGGGERTNNTHDPSKKSPSFSLLSRGKKGEKRKRSKKRQKRRFHPRNTYLANEKVALSRRDRDRVGGGGGGRGQGGKSRVSFSVKKKWQPPCRGILGSTGNKRQNFQEPMRKGKLLGRKKSARTRNKTEREKRKAR